MSECSECGKQLDKIELLKVKDQGVEADEFLCDICEIEADPSQEIVDEAN